MPLTCPPPDALPTLPGAYWLVLTLPHPARLRVGRLGEALFPRGFYLYTGSAHGPGGVRARLGRHLRGSPHRRWHIDFLRAVAAPLAWGWTTAPDPALPWECRWAQALAASPGAFIPLAGFGASDCRAHCPAHLVGFLSLAAAQHAATAATRGTMEACWPQPGDPAARSLSNNFSEPSC